MIKTILKKFWYSWCLLISGAVMLRGFYVIAVWDTAYVYTTPILLPLWMYATYWSYCKLFNKPNIMKESSDD